MFSLTNENAYTIAMRCAQLKEETRAVTQEERGLLTAIGALAQLATAAKLGWCSMVVFVAQGHHGPQSIVCAGSYAFVEELGRHAGLSSHFRSTIQETKDIPFQGSVGPWSLNEFTIYPSPTGLPEHGVPMVDLLVRSAQSKRAPWVGVGCNSSSKP